MPVSDDKMKANIKPIRSLSMSSCQPNRTGEIVCKVDGALVALDELPSHEVCRFGTLGSNSDTNYFDDKIHTNSSEELTVDAKSCSNDGDSKAVLSLISLILLSVFPSSLSKKDKLENITVPDRYRGSNLKGSNVRKDIPDDLVFDVDGDSSPEKEGGEAIPEELLIKLFSRKEVYLCGRLIHMDMYLCICIYVYVWTYIYP